MAYIIPSDISRLSLSGVHPPELETLFRLRAELPNDYTVFHGVHWSREYNTGAQFGEIDFIVVNRSGDVLFIEQKNGILEESENGLAKSYRDRDKSVVDQVRRSIDNVVHKFSRRHPDHGALSRDYLLYLPDYRVKDVNAAGLAESRVVDAGSRESLSARIRSLQGTGADDDRPSFDRVHGFFCQAFRVVVDVSTFSQAHETHFVRQAGVAADVLVNLDMEPFRLRFEGAAGSGKSLLAHQFFSREASRGKRVLWVCFNRPLAERLCETVHTDDGYVNNFHGFCTEFLESDGQALRFPRKPDAGFWQELQDRVSGQDIPEAWLFDSLIVDEGQDFEQEWMEILSLFIRPDASVLWLQDMEQNLYSRNEVQLDGYVAYRCRDNYRTPETIARFILDTLPVDFEPRNALPGLGVDVYGYEEPGEQLKIVDRIIQERVQQGFVHEDIVVITCRGVEKSVFFEADAVGGIPLRRPTGEYRDHKQVFTDGKILYDSIYRYKGQQSPSVILVDVDPAGAGEHERRKLYCGMTRATIRLDIVVSRSNPGNQELLR